MTPFRWFVVPTLAAALLAVFGCSKGTKLADTCHHLPTDGGTVPVATSTAHIQTVFLILFENHNWSAIRGNPSAPYINGTVLPAASHAEQYFNPKGLHPSEPNYLWLEGGTNYGISDDGDPAENHLSNTDHLVTQLTAVGISWKSYQEDIDGTECPLASQGLYAPKHNPMVFFNDVTGNNDPHSPNCISHVRPFSELATDLQAGRLARYNFITPNLCNDMHNSVGCESLDSVRNGDVWLSKNLPQILNSNVYKNNGAVFITWDESEGGDHPIGMIAISPFAKGNGYSNSIPYTHSSTLRTMQEIFGVRPFLCAAENSNDLSDLFAQFP